MRKVSIFLLILGVLLFSINSLSYAQIHKVKISELKENVADENPNPFKNIEYQSHMLTKPVFTNSPGTIAGYTWYDYQHNGTMSRMIALDSAGGIHFDWMCLEYGDITSNRYVYYNYLDPAGNWLAPEWGVRVTPPIARGGYTGIAGILPDGREVLCFHQTQPYNTPWYSTLAIEKTTGGLGDFYRYDLPDSIPGVGTREFWPKAVLDSLNNIHVVMSQALSGAIRPQALGYTRCRLEDDTLICEAPGIDTVRIPPNTRISDPLKNRCAFFDSSGTISQIVVTSPVSKKVAIIYTKYTNPNKSPSFGDVYYIESTNGGQDWIDAGGFASVEKHNITHYTINDTLRAYFDLAAVYDYNDNLHILWTTPGYWEAQDSATTDACFLWHWSQATGMSLVADGWKPSQPGNFNNTISKMSIGVNPTNNYLYAIWTQFDISDTAANGYSNGEIYASASKDNGLTWDGPKDLTVTPTPGCQAGQCESDHWASLAERVNDTLHIQYINDKDAGAAIQGASIQQEGAYTNNPVLYLKVPAWEPEIFRVNFSGTPKAGFKPLTVQFADSSVGNIISRLWDLGGGITDTSKNPVHIYSDTGYYTVKLSVSSPGSSYAILKANYIAVFDTLKVDFTAEPTYGHEPLTASFQSIFNETPERLIWYFGDGRISYEPNPVHEYTEFGNYDVKLVAELCGYKDSVVKEEYIQAVGIRTEFSANKRCGSNPLTVTFSDSSTGTNPIVAWHWDFGDGDTSSQQNPTHQFLQEGIYDITLIAFDGMGADTLTKEDYIIVQDSLSADFSGVPDSGKSPLNVTFEPILSGLANQFFWDFGDGDTSNLINPIHTYTNQGKYDVKLIAKLELDDCHYADTAIKEDYVMVNDLKADFHADVTMGLEPLSVHFYDVSSGNPDSWHWDFGDGNTDTLQNPIHIYSDTGHFDVRLIVSNQIGSDTLIRLNYIAVYDTLSVDFTGIPTLGRKPLTVSFQNLCSSTPDSVIWYFGDGQTSIQLNPVHKYTEFGNYDVKLVAELFGYKDSVIKEEYIKVSDIKSEFSADKRCGSSPLTITFNDSSMGTYPKIYWHWDFGDGDTSNLQNPTHQFTNTDVFDITLIVSDSIGADTLTKKGYIITQDSVSADFIGLPVSGKPPLTVMFEPVLEGIANQYFWDFGDGDTSSLRNPIHTYTNLGKYDIKLKVRLELDECNQVDSVIKEDYIIVNDLEAQFSTNPTAGVQPLTVQFTDESSGNPISWFWDFGDANTSTERNPQHQYDSAGVYDVFLRVSNGVFSDSLMRLHYIRVDTSFADLSCEYFYSGDSRPGFDAWLWPAWTNIGVAPAYECTMRVVLPTDVVLLGVECYAMQSGTCSPYSLFGDTVVVPLSTVDPTNPEGGYLELWVKISDAIQLGDTLVWEMWLTTTTPERDYRNNYCRFELEVTGSIDPNDKLAYPEGEGVSYTIKPDQRLGYTVRFENKAEATAEAIYIRVVDTLSQNLDWGTLAVGASSHPDKCDYEFNPYTGEIIWFCDSIMLPPNVNPPAGEGYFTYSISPKKGLPDETEIANTAWIRFDYNEWLQAPMDGPILRTIKYPFIRGDANGDKKLTVSDVIYIINYLFRGGPEPVPLQSADCNCDTKVTVSDVVYLINYLFKGGPPPSC